MRASARGAAPVSCSLVTLVVLIAMTVGVVGPFRDPSPAAGQHQAAPVDREGRPRLLWLWYEPTVGVFLVDWNGRTVYYSTQDSDESACYDLCAESWPPLLLPAYLLGEQLIPPTDTVERQDGTRQITHEGRPLYYNAADAEPGDARGHGQDCVWFALVRRLGSDFAC